MIEKVEVKEVGDHPDTHEKRYQRWPAGLGDQQHAFKDFLLNDSDKAEYIDSLASKGSLSAEEKHRLEDARKSGINYDEVVDELVDARTKYLFEIPFPEPTIQEPTSDKYDTTRSDSENSTFVAQLKEPPMPPSVIDELRNKYSKFRTRFPDDEQRALREEKRMNRDIANRSSMRTPTEELSALRAEQRRRQQPKDKNQFLNEIGTLLAAREANVR